MAACFVGAHDHCASFDPGLSWPHHVQCRGAGTVLRWCLVVSEARGFSCFERFEVTTSHHRIALCSAVGPKLRELQAIEDY